MDNNSPLNLAHLSGRNAEKFLKKKDFDQAIECHLNASILLQEAMTLASFAKSLESLHVQKNYHLSQTKIIKAQKHQFALKKQSAELKKKKKMEKRKSPEIDQKDKELQWAIFRAVEQTDSLINQLHENQERGSENNIEGASKEAKDVKTILEELKESNSQLRSLITKLFTQLERDRRETESLKSRLKLYERQNLPDLAPLDLPSFDFSHI